MFFGFVNRCRSALSFGRAGPAAGVDGIESLHISVPRHGWHTKSLPCEREVARSAGGIAIPVPRHGCHSKGSPDEGELA